ncbi:MAG: RRXRR domain-containing protein, partial [Methanosarcinales archaeon]
MTVYVISKKGRPLMPTKRHGKVRKLLKQGLAKVARTTPFTIKLLYVTTEYTQPVI